MNTLKVFTIKNKNGMELKVTNYGATVIGLKVPDKYKNRVNVIIGLEQGTDYIEEPYINTPLFLGSTVGRYAGRISNGKFNIDENTYTIHHKNGVHLHGGKNGFSKKYWSVKNISNQVIQFSYTSKDMEEGYPGNLEVEATFELTDNNCLKIIYKAKTDSKTIVNLTCHPYFNLNGKGSILNHDLTIRSDYHLEVDAQLLPTGILKESKNTLFDYREKSKVAKEGFIGLDDTFVLNKENLKASLMSDKNGINMDVYSNQEAMVVYTPIKFPSLPFKQAINDNEFPAICFETQNYPDAPNNSHFPSSVLKPNEEYLNETVFQFSIV